MTPYLFLSFAYLGAKTVMGSLADHPLEDNAFLGVFLGISPCYGAWFLWVLFVMSTIVILLRKVNVVVLFLAFFLLSLIPWSGHDGLLHGFWNVQILTLWLLLGCVLSKYYDKVQRFITWKLAALATILVFALHLLGGLPKGTSLWLVNLYGELRTLMGITMSFSLCYLLATKASESFLGKALQTCGNYCMDIYILSMFVLVPLRILYVNVGLMNYIPYYIWVVLASFAGVLIPYYVSKYLVRKNKLLGILLLGRFPK